MGQLGSSQVELKGETDPSATAFNDPALKNLEGQLREINIDYIKMRQAGEPDHTSM